eukprot:CAMPEP_0180505146 /NCGR_PEP_ID=MMETSP1036_2-20121128/47194_1 /TAXON_ID=632150 /ORGANISM="Azadinium spinosum, Strain 3D9" /LENGTH=165 /DNA_ID=CAMNT_0022514789 /DNA_START=224 /DNA_END=718 /DNA_ORIENTATION=+
MSSSTWRMALQRSRRSSSSSSPWGVATRCRGQQRRLLAEADAAAPRNWRGGADLQLEASHHVLEHTGGDRQVVAELVVHHAAVASLRSVLCLALVLLNPLQDDLRLGGLPHRRVHHAPAALKVCLAAQGAHLPGDLASKGLDRLRVRLRLVAILDIEGVGIPLTS